METIHEHPVYHAPCIYCNRPINGIVYVKHWRRFQVGARQGTSFFYSHFNCKKKG